MSVYREPLLNLELIKKKKRTVKAHLTQDSQPVYVSLYEADLPFTPRRHQTWKRAGI